ncbi:hypothetical protein DFR65_101514 [Oceanihabitans sediminis]|uniref:Lipoprotein n=1 Tax=Oceanihabitans sediminis TaxID=1812012 RepID=A0A368P8N5_9FLAO|nr:hypothetical protein [Oceanihabitans sediminis]RBP34617.1 hypothetical protein DFR65_101514 [Oceanihabitans sediminis]RCU58275.1 hypothetical protein DU428_02550 [Oceanihabitans sediminis]
MTKFRLSILVTATLLLISIITTSCSNENISDEKITNEIKTTGTMFFEQNSNNFSTAKNNNHTNKYQELNIEFSFISDDPLPDFNNDEELTNYFQNNIDQLNGSFIYSINNEILYESIVINGIENALPNTNDNYTQQLYRGCDYESIRQCTRDSIDNMGTISKLVCIAAGFACVAEEFANCAYTNCGGPQL